MLRKGRGIPRSAAPTGCRHLPLLANIYLHELDLFMLEMKAQFDKGKRRGYNPAYQTLSNRIGKKRQKIARMKANGADRTAIREVEREIKAVEAERRKIPPTDPFDPNYRRLLYCRYADDFIIGITGSKEDAKQIMDEVKSFLARNLKLEISESKSGIYKASNGARFLGYDIRTHSANHRKPKTVKGRKYLWCTITDSVQLHSNCSGPWDERWVAAA